MGSAEEVPFSSLIASLLLKNDTISYSDIYDSVVYFKGMNLNNLFVINYDGDSNFEFLSSILVFDTDYIYFKNGFGYDTVIDKHTVYEYLKLISMGNKVSIKVKSSFFYKKNKNLFKEKTKLLIPSFMKF